MEFDPDEYEGAASDVVEEITSDVDQEEASSETEEALTAAMQRIEEANLWKILIKQDVFEEGSARAEILLAANRKIKKFALDELNKLLNINQKEVAPQKVEVQLPFDKDEMLALKVLAAKVLKREPSSVVVPEDRTPKVKSVSVPQQEPIKTVTEPSISKVSSPSRPSQPTGQPVQKSVQKQPAKKGGRYGGGKGYAKPTKRMAMPSADQLINMQLPAAQISTENISQREMQAADPASLIQTVVANLTGGNVVSQHATVSEEDDVNGRL